MILILQDQDVNADFQLYYPNNEDEDEEEEMMMTMIEDR